MEGPKNRENGDPGRWPADHGHPMLEGAAMRSSTILSATLLAASALACRSSGRPAALPPPSTDHPVTSASLTSSEIDLALRAEWAKRKIVPAGLVDDGRFLRRVSLDIIGRIPTLAEIDAFEREPSAGRRARVVARLLQSGEY